MNMLAQMTWFQWFLGAGIIAVCGLLLLVVLIQRGRGQGLAGAFGGGGGGGAFGAKTGDVFTVITVGLAAVFLFLNVVGNFAFDQTPQPVSAADTTDPATTDPGTPTAIVPGEGFEPSITFEGTTESGEPLEIKLDGALQTAEDAAPAAEGDATTGSGSEAPTAADQPDAKTDDSGTKTKDPGAGGESGGGSNQG